MCVATRTNALWQRGCTKGTTKRVQPSQPARMRCGKGHGPQARSQDRGRNPHECAVAKVNVYYFAAEQLGRNPHECAVAKRVDGVVVKTENVATRTNALWQSAASVVPLLEQ